MSAPPDSTDARLQALRRFFLLRYREEIQSTYQTALDIFPLIHGSRLDLVRVNGGQRVHFVYRPGQAGEHLVVIHDLTIVAGGAPESEELRFVANALRIDDAVTHFVVRPPYEGGFEQVEHEAVSAVARHARMHPHHVHGRN